MKIMAVLVDCVAKIAEIVYPIEKIRLTTIKYAIGTPITEEAKKVTSINSFDLTLIDLSKILILSTFSPDLTCSILESTKVLISPLYSFPVLLITKIATTIVIAKIIISFTYSVILLYRYSLKYFFIAPPFLHKYSKEKRLCKQK